MLFDTHAHYNDERFDADRDDILSSMPENNVGYILNSCSSLSEVKDIIKIIEKYPFIYGSAGVHPHEVKGMKNEDLDILKKYAAHEKIKAIGEIGLDYYYDFSPRSEQKKWFSLQAELAAEIDLPVIIHDRDAHKDTTDILRACAPRGIRGVFHCYSGSVETAGEILDMGMYLAFGGSLTFKNSRRPAEAAEYAPLDRILIETDSPYLAPVPMRGKRNSSLYIHFVAEKLAQIKNMSVEEIEKITTENAKRCFNI